MKTLKQFEEMIKEIKKYSVIFLFHHINPDCDTLGFKYGIFNWLKLNFPKKKIFLVNENNVTYPSYFVKNFKNNNLDIEKINYKSILGIVGDVNVLKRIDGYEILEKYCSKTLIVDHHIPTKSETFYDLAIIEPNVSSTCELFASILFALKKYKLSKNVFFPLMYGMITDTGRFLHGEFNSNLFTVVSKILDMNICLKPIYNDLYSKSANLVRYFGEIQSKFIQKNNLAFFVVDENILRKYNISYDTAKSAVNLLSFVEKIDIYALFVYDKNKKIWSGSLRSQKYSVHDFAIKHNGGGHKFASAIKIKTKKELIDTIESLKLYAQSCKT